MGCFWGGEQLFWELKGVYVTAVGYAGGSRADPTYEQVCTGETGHAEVVLVIYDSKNIDLECLLAIFWESHDPTQGNRQGNDMGSQYRSTIFVETEAEFRRVQESKYQYEQQLRRAGCGSITTEIDKQRPFYYAEAYHQQYLAKRPGSHCNQRGQHHFMP